MKTNVDSPILSTCQKWCQRLSSGLHRPKVYADIRYGSRMRRRHQQWGGGKQPSFNAIVALSSKPLEMKHS